MLVVTKIRHEPIIASWSTGTDEEIIEALYKHYTNKIDISEYWSVGDKRTIKVMQSSSEYTTPIEVDCTFVLTNIGGKRLVSPLYGHNECAFQVDLEFGDVCYNQVYATNTNVGGWRDSKLRDALNNGSDAFKNRISSTISEIFKEFYNESALGGQSSQIVEVQDTFAARSMVEICGTDSSDYPAGSIAEGEGSQVSYYETTANRRKYMDNSNIFANWTRTPLLTNSTQFYLMRDATGSGTITYSPFNSNVSTNIYPFGVI